MKESHSMSLRAVVGLLFVFAAISIVSAYGTANPVAFGHSAGELDFTGFNGNVTTGGSIIANQLCIGTDCRTSWPTFSSTIINSTVVINNATTLNLTTFMSSNFIINGTVFLNGTLVINNTVGTVIVLNNTFTINTTIFSVTNNSFFTTLVTNNTIFTPNPINLNSISGNVIASGDVQGGRLCIGTDCRTSWPTLSGSSTGGPSIIFQAQRFTDDDTNYYIDINTGAYIGGTWDLNGQLRANSVCIGGDCRTSWPTSSSSSGATIIHTSVTAVSDSSGKSMPRDSETQWMITGGHRFCANNGYTTGTVVEYYHDNGRDDADVACFH